VNNCSIDLSMQERNIRLLESLQTLNPNFTTVFKSFNKEALLQYALCGGLGGPSAPNSVAESAKPNMLNLVSKEVPVI